jgi:hypothetical protein
MRNEIEFLHLRRLQALIEYSVQQVFAAIYGMIEGVALVAPSCQANPRECAFARLTLSA